MEKSMILVYNYDGDCMKDHIQAGKLIIRTLKRFGYEAYFVGGFVRDYLLNIPTHDIDITTSATIEEIKPLFNKVVLTGEKYGTVTVLIGDVGIEVTTYRKDGEYKDYRRPENVVYTKTLKEDLARRDFTINQLVMDENNHVFDHFNGKEDLKNQIIRTIGDAHARFNEDSLRLLRAFRFVAKLDFSLEEKTQKAIYDLRHQIHYIAIERIQNELKKIIAYPYKQKAFKAMLDTKFSESFFGLETAIKLLSETSIDYDEIHAYALFLKANEDLPKTFILSKKTLRKIEQIHRIMYQTKDDDYTLELLFHEGLEAALDANTVHQFYKKEDRAYEIKEKYHNLPIKSVCELAFKGEDILKKTPIKKRKHIGLILDMMIIEVLYQRLNNHEEDLKAFVLKTIKKLEESDLL